jgi:DNA methylase
VLDNLVIPSPKRRPSRDGFQQLYPYYAGFPEAFVRSLLSSPFVKSGSVIYDPWNGSGTTTAVASRLGLPALGFDLNPAMVIVAKARLLPASEGPSLDPLARAILKRARSSRFQASADDPLAVWFKPKTALALRAIERSCNEMLIEPSPLWKIEELSSIAANFYTSLFSISRRMASAFRTANPTWMRAPKNRGERPEFSREEIEERFVGAVAASRLAVGRRDPFQRVACEVTMNDATLATPAQAVDCVLTSPPYCTRIDYTAGTRIELALIAPLVSIDTDELRRGMIGTTMVPKESIQPRDDWGNKCNRFLDAVHNHPSKASKGYYHVTHLDYFDKMFRSIVNLSSALKAEGNAILVVQDSYYKDVHNDLPAIIEEMAATCNLHLQKRADFHSTNCMSRVNSRAAAYSTREGSTESVLIFAKS